MSVLIDIETKWAVRLREWKSFGAQVNGAVLAEEILADLAELARGAALQAINLREASECSGYTVDHLQRLVAQGRLENVGRKGKPLIRRGDLPRRPTLHNPSPDIQFRGRRRIVASVAHKAK